MKIPESAPSLRAKDFASISVRVNAATVATSGLGAPARTATPIRERTRSTRLAASSRPCRTRPSIACEEEDDDVGRWLDRRLCRIAAGEAGDDGG